jgi:hypothetical protein
MRGSCKPAKIPDFIKEQIGGTAPKAGQRNLPGNLSGLPIHIFFSAVIGVFAVEITTR